MNFIASQFRRHQSTGWKCIDRFGVGLSVDARPNSDISPSISLSTPVENSHNFFPTSVFLRTRGCSRGCSRARSSSYQQQNPHSRIARSFKSEEISVTVEILESREHRMPRISHGASTPSLEQHLHTINLDAQTPNETGKTTTLKCPIPKHRPAWKTPRNKPQPVATTFAPQPSTNSIGLLPHKMGQTWHKPFLTSSWATMAGKWERTETEEKKEDVEWRDRTREKIG